MIYTRHLVNAVISLPLLDVKVRILRTLTQTLVITRLGTNFSADKRSELGLAEILRHDVCAHFAPFNQVSSVLCVPTHGARSVALVEAAADVLCCELEVAVFAHAEDLRGSHCCGGRRGFGR